jgi:predicted Ser/Thr protein kinase
MSDDVGGDTIKVPDEPNDQGNLDVKSGPPSSPSSPPSYINNMGGDTIKSDSVKGAETPSGKPDSQKPAQPKTELPKSSSANPSSTTSASKTHIPKSDSQGGVLRKPPSSTKSRLDDIPEEAAQFAEDPARQLGAYILVKQIGKGGMGAVWKAWDKKLTRWVAIKFLLVAEDEDVLRFQREAKLAARLRHPNIAPIYEVGEAPATQAGQQTRHYLAMEYIDGSTMASATSLPVNELLDIFMKVAQGMEAAHKAGVVHRDLKPANIMLTSDKWPYVMDFGLAKAIQAESSISVSGAVMGTPAYMPPEQAEGRLDQIDAQSDVYSLGATMYAVLCKKQPFQGQTPMEILMKVCKEDPIPPRTHNPELPEAVETILLKTMMKNKADRYPSALALAEDLKRYLSNQEIEAKGPSSLKLAANKAKRNIWPILVVLLVLGGGGVIAWMALKPKPPVIVIKDPIKDPNGTIKDPPPEDLAGKKAAAWFNAWGSLAEPLDFDFWKPGDATLADRINKHLVAMKADAPAREGDVRFWFGKQTDKSEDALKDVRNSRDVAAAGRLVGWCDTFLGSLKGVEFLSRYREQTQKTRDAAAQIANYKGSVTLKILVGPFAEVTKLTTGGKDFPLKQRVTPLMIGGIEVGDVEIELTHPTLGKKVEKIPASKLKDGKVYEVTGTFKDALRLKELP